MKKILQLIFHRVVIGAVLMLLQLALLVLMMVEFQKYFVYFYAICTVISILVTLYLVNNNHTNPAYKIAWMIPILLVPVFGGLFYIVGRPRISRRQRERMSGMAGNFSHIDPGASEPLAKLQQENPSAAGQSRYIERCGYCPPYENTTVEYLPLGEVKFERMLTELKAAKKFIFLEYFIIQEGKMWDPILEILEQKVKEGVEVRVMYDDFGCMMTLPARYWGTLEKKGIQCCVFNPFVPVLSLRFNNRDHRMGGNHRRHQPGGRVYQRLPQARPLEGCVYPAERGRGLGPHQDVPVHVGLPAQNPGGL